MKWKDLKQYLVLDGEEQDLKLHGFVSWVVKDEFMIRVQSDWDGNYWTANYFQIYEDVEDGVTSQSLVVQLDGLPEDPFSRVVGVDADEMELPVEVYTLLIK